MATEAKQTPADIPSPDNSQDALTERRPDVIPPSTSTPPLQVNGEASTSDGDTKGLEDKTVQPTSAAVSVSGGSDTDASKGESTKLLGIDDKGHARATSIVKKPITFKTVSVNKTFLAAKGATGPAASKLGENKPITGTTAVPIGTSTSATLRPRLVAKTRSGLRDSAPRSSASTNGGKAGSAPDPSAVWNKNRPAPPTDQKRLTDDDLRKQFGIHLATRIQGDDQGQGKQANWADIDDDEDDWAPDTIEWTDGTKVTVQPADEPTPAPVEQPKAPVAAEPSKPQPVVPSSTASSTVKLGGISGGSGKGLVLKGAAEKPTLVAKPPGPPNPVKSPWAPLPPVDKVAPVVIDPHSSQPPKHALPRFQEKDPHGFESMPAKPTKEIAADDFSRGAWRDNVQNRELYNSQSGRYEPVPDNKRNSRNDIPPRHPALLQRPVNHEQQGPAEPSGAFQTHRTGGETSYGRRRNSSNVSGGGGNNIGRSSFSRAGDTPTSHEFQGPRRGSLATVSDAPASPLNLPSAVQHTGQRGNNQPWQSRGSLSTTQAPQGPTQGQKAAPPPVGKQLLPVEEGLEIQKKVMAESREAARKRRADMEAKEEAERKERIRVKLEAMGPAPESNKQKKDAFAEAKATLIQARDSADVPPKPVTVEMTEPKESTTVSKTQPVQSVTSQKNAEATRNGQDSSLGQDHNNSPAAEERRKPSDVALPPPQSDNSPQPWQNAPQINKYPGWNAQRVWGNNGSIGNGTFLQETAGAQAGPGPIGPPNAYRSNNQQNNRGREQYSSRPAPIGPPNGHSALQRPSVRQSAHTLPANNPWANANIRADDKDMAAYREKQNAIQSAREAVEGVKEPEVVDTWRRVTLEGNGERSRVKVTSTITKPATVNGIPLDENTSARLPATPLAPNGIHHDSLSGSIPNNASAPGIPTTPLAPNGLHPESPNNASTSSISAAPPAQRGSRFFPMRDTRDIRVEDGYSFGRLSSISPPPPTMAGHPAYDGDSVHPHVNFPPPPPVVKLPPATLAPIGPPKPAPSFATAAKTNLDNWPAQSMRQTARQQLPPAQGTWLNKIDNLLNRKPSPPKTYALAVDSSSKYAYESEARSSASVALPGTTLNTPWDDGLSFTTRSMSEECFEEQEMGSVPVINLPRPSGTPRMSAPRMRHNPPKPKVPEVTSGKCISFYHETGFNGPTITVQLPGVIPKKSVPAPFLGNNRQRSNQGRGGQRGGPSRGGGPYGRGGRRESSNYPPPPPPPAENAPSSPPHNHPARRGTGRGKGYGYATFAQPRARQPAHTLPANNPWATVDIRADDREKAAERAREEAARSAREALEGVKEPEIVDTWRAVTLEENGERSRHKVVSTVTKPATLNGVPVTETTSSRVLAT